MKFETLMLHSLFAACLLVCVLTLGSMIATTSVSETVASHAPVATAVSSIG
ncbi:hypothetical protein [Dyella sp. 20L07]|uniref:hypothetical protein n=1 Tax=Dyella sp. 20L07 TaxID=3384240 RepID=UPI003D29ED14